MEAVGREWDAWSWDYGVFATSGRKLEGGQLLKGMVQGNVPPEPWEGHWHVYLSVQG